MTTTTTSETTIVIGASRGIGLGVAHALAEGSGRTVGISRTAPVEPVPGVTHVQGDATDPSLPARVLDEFGPTNVVIVAGAVPHMRRMQEQTWDTFSLAWNVDVQITFNWVREMLLRPPPAESKLIVFSSGAALGGSPLSGGYAGAKATQRFITDYARRESEQEQLGIGFTSIMSKFAPETGVGRSAVDAYAREARMPREEFLKHHEPTLTPALAGQAVRDLLVMPADELRPAYLLDGRGLKGL